MKIKGLLVIAVLTAIIASSCTQSSITSSKVKTADDSLAYALGVLYGTYYQRDSLNIDPVLVAKGMLDAKNEKNELDENAAQGYVMMAMQKKEAEKMEKMFGPKREEGEKFLLENKKREGVIETASGLQYEVVVMGTGAKPGEKDRVRVNYTGMLLDSTIFDSSEQRGKPIDFMVGQVIKGWQEGLQLMPVGSKFKLYIPYELAYGERGSQKIPPYSTLMFDVELLEIIEK